jgi:hypothetical protein
MEVKDGAIAEEKMAGNNGDVEVWMGKTICQELSGYNSNVMWILVDSS